VFACAGNISYIMTFDGYINTKTYCSFSASPG